MKSNPRRSRFITRLLPEVHPQSCYYYSVEHGGFQASPNGPRHVQQVQQTSTTASTTHYYTTYQVRYGRATYDALRRSVRATSRRDEGVALVRRLMASSRALREEIFRYLSIPQRVFSRPSKMFEQPIWTARTSQSRRLVRSPHLGKYEHGKWQAAAPVWHESDDGQRR